MSNDNTSNHQFYGQFDPPVDQFLYERYFADRQGPGVFIECGAFDGITESSCKFFEETLGWTAYNIEASERVFQALVRNRPDSNNFQLALSNNEGMAEFSDCTIEGYELCTNGSLRHLPEHADWLASVQCEITKSLVPTTTFRHFVDQYSLTCIDLMVLDVEGHELEALQGFEGSAVLPKVLCVEHGQLGESTVRQAVERMGYAFDTTSHVNSFFVL